MTDILLWIFGAVTLLSALFILLTKSILNAAYSLVVCLLSLAAIYILLQAEFVGVTQLMIYVGGIIVLLLFAVMLTHKLAGAPLVTTNYNRMLAMVASVVTLGGITYMAGGFEAPGRLMPDNVLVETGKHLMTTYLLPMELVAILLLAVLMGAATIAADTFRKEIKK